VGLVSFQLDDRLARDTFVIGDLPLCRVLLMNDARWPWLILVRRREGMVELIDVELADQTQLMDEAGRASRFLTSHLRQDQCRRAWKYRAPASSVYCRAGCWRSGLAWAGMGA
jgi:diadenosine tetraphosphate (Ap4A) HIT family hydrolase